MDTNDCLRIDSGDGIVTLSLDRPARRNALDLSLVRALRTAIEYHSHASAIVVRSATPSIFCAGADLSVADAERALLSRELYALYGEIVALERPVIAALDGAAVGGGAQLAIACDLRVASPAASLRLVGPAHGLAVGAWALPSLVGRGRALDLCLSGRVVAGEDALSIGLVDRLDADPDGTARQLAVQLAALDFDAVARVKAVVARAVAGGPGPALDAEARGNAQWDGRARDPGAGGARREPR